MRRPSTGWARSRWSSRRCEAAERTCCSLPRPSSGSSPRAGREVSGLTPAAAERLLTYHWPGNVRELRDCIERAVSLATGPQISFEDLPERIRTFRGWQMLTSRANLEELVPIAELERRYILHVLEVVGGSRTLAARTLGLDRKTLYRRLEQYGIQPERPRRRRAG